jgi:hypothetical protein
MTKQIGFGMIIDWRETLYLLGSCCWSHQIAQYYSPDGSFVDSSPEISAVALGSQHSERIVKGEIYDPIMIGKVEKTKKQDWNSILWDIPPDFASESHVILLERMFPTS